MATRKDYTKEFKREAVRLADEAPNKSQVARDRGIHLSMLRRWKEQLHENGERAFPGKGNPQDAELAQLKRDNTRLKEEVEVLKKALGIFSTRPR